MDLPKFEVTRCLPYEACKVGAAFGLSSLRISSLCVSESQPIDYPAPQAPLSTDILTSVALTGTNHTEDQPVHLRLPPGNKARSAHVKTNVEEYAGLLSRACPAAVYEYVDDEGMDGTTESGGYNGKKFVINSQVSLRMIGISLSGVANGPAITG